jgi:hypothetical protein
MRVHGLAALPLLLIAVAGLVVGLALPAAARETSHLINGSSINAHTISGSKLENNTVTGKQINESTLGTVPTARSAQTASSAKTIPALVWHPVIFAAGWSNYDAKRPAAYAIDAQGIVRLRGAVNCASLPCDPPMFVLPTAATPEVPVNVLIDTVNDSVSDLLILVNGDVSALPTSGSSSEDIDDYSSLDGVSYALR